MRIQLIAATLLACTVLGGPPASAADGAWHLGRSLPEGRDHAVAVAGSHGTIYVVGGQGYDDYDAVYARDPATERWHTAMRIPVREGAAVAMLDGRIYVVGGRAGATMFRSVLMVAPGRRTLTRGIPLPEARANGRAVVVGGSIYVVGGNTATGPAGDVIRFDPGTRRWSRVTDLPTARYGYAVAKDHLGSIYLIGGVPHGASYGAPPLDLVESFDTATGKWRTRAPLPAGRYESAATVTPNGTVMVAGGAVPGEPEAAHSVYGTRDVFVYDPAANTWAVRPSLRVGVLWNAMVAADGRIWSIGGATDSGVDECCYPVVQYLPPVTAKANFSAKCELPGCDR